MSTADLVQALLRRGVGHYVDAGMAASSPESVALVVGGKRVSYAELTALTARSSDRLLQSGLRAGDVVAVQSANTLEYVVGLFGAAQARLVVAPLDPALPAAERLMRLEMAGARLVVLGCPDPSLDGFPTLDLAGDGSVPELRSGPAPALADDDVLVMFTSGTTGEPKMVPWTQANVAASVAGIVDAYGLGPSDATVAVMPLFHGHGLVSVLLATLASGGRILLPAGGRFSAKTFWDDIDTVGATWYTAVPTIHQILLDRAGDGAADRGLRFIRSCSAPLSPAVVRRIEAAFGAPMLAAYGMTETTHQCSSVLPSADEAARVAAAGQPTSAAVRIVDGTGRDVPAGAAGEIWFSGPTVVRGYLENPDATASTFVDGWLRTGDLGVVDADGAVSVIGRIKEQINRGGEKISPERVEQVLLAHPDVAQVVVFGVPCKLFGERVAAAVVPHEGHHPDHFEPDLATHSRGRLAPFEIPERIVFADDLPLTAKGSVDRAKAVERFAPGLA